MSNRKMLYGYQIRDGEIAIVEEEAILVRRIFSLYTSGLSYQKISDLLNMEKIPYSQEAPAWNKHKIKRLLENPRYMGQDSYPPILDSKVFQETQVYIQEKTAGHVSKEKRPVLCLKNQMHCAQCGNTLRRLGGKNRRKNTMYLKCVSCDAVFTISDDDLISEIVRQVTAHDSEAQRSYQPSGEVIRLTNAINRGLERPDHPEELISLILQGAAARYDCCPLTVPSERENHPLDVDWNRILQVVSHITISAENMVAVTFR